MLTTVCRAFALLLGLGLPVPIHAAQGVVVEAGPWDRTEAIVEFPLPGGSDAMELRAADGTVRPLQFAGGRAWFIERDLPRGSTRRYEIVPAGERRSPSRVRAKREDDRVDLELDGQSVLSYLAGQGALPRSGIDEAFRRGGYMHPVRTPSGRVVTDDYPPNHIHHHGLWWAWTRTVFEDRRPDFWNMGERKGRVDFAGLDGMDAGPVFAGFRSRQVFTDLLSQPGMITLEETWNVRLLAIGGRDRFHAFDLVSEQRCAGASPLKLPKYYYGGFGYRGPFAWNGARNARYLDANGVTDRVKANETRARWYWFGGEVEGRLAGVAILGHPSNFRAPQPLRVHPNEPFICWAPSQLGDWEIVPGTAYVSRYRVLAFDGEPDAALLERLWNDYAEPPLVRED